MSSDDHLLPRLADALRRWRGWTHRRDFDDRHGRYAILARHADAGAFVCACKAHRHEGDVSVMRRAVEHAASGGASVAVFVGSTPTLGRAWAFDPALLFARGEAFRIESKRGATVEAIQIDPAEGACLGDVVSGRDVVPEAGVADRTRQGRLTGVKS